MLDWLARRKNDQNAARAAKVIQQAVEDCLAAKEFTPDLGGHLGTLEMGKAISNRISAEGR